MNYSLFLDLEALRFLLSLKAGQRAKLLEWLEQLQGTPFKRGQFTVQDSVGREVQVSVTSLFVIYHWTDHAAKTVQIRRIELNLP